MDGNEPAGVFREIIRGLIPERNHADLELHLHQIRIQILEQQRIGQPAVVELRVLERLVVQELLDAGLLRGGGVCRARERRRRGRRLQRTGAEAERQGMDLHELDAGAYPDFMTHEK